MRFGQKFFGNIEEIQGKEPSTKGVIPSNTIAEPTEGVIPSITIASPTTSPTKKNDNMNLYTRYYDNDGSYYVFAEQIKKLNDEKVN